MAKYWQNYGGVYVPVLADNEKIIGIDEKGESIVIDKDKQCETCGAELKWVRLALVCPFHGFSGKGI